MTGDVPGRRGEGMVFVVGCPRSGTTWVQRLLAAHPRVRTGQESNLFEHYVGPALRHWHEGLDPRNRGGVGMPCYLEEDAFRRLFDAWFDGLLAALLAGVGEGELFVEKSPHHALYLPEIHELLPGARVVHVIRDARDAVASLLAANRSWGAHWAPRDAIRAGMTWVRNVNAVRDAQRRLPDLPVHDVRYEDLQARPEHELRRLAAFLGLEWSDEDVARAIAENDPRGPGTPIPLGGAVARRSTDRVEEPEGFVRKARSGTWRSDLSLKERFLTWLVARRTMREMGYVWRLPL